MRDVPGPRPASSRPRTTVERDVAPSREGTGEPSGTRWDPVLSVKGSPDPWADPKRFRHRRLRRRVAIRRWIMLGLTLAVVVVVFVLMYLSQ